MNRVNKKRKLENYLRRPYLRVVTPDEETGTFTAEILEFPGCIAQGNSVKEVYSRIENAAMSWIDAALDSGHEIPEPVSTNEFGGKVLLRLPRSVHRQITLTAERENTSLNQFILSAISEKLGAVNLYEKLIENIERRTQQIAIQTAIQITQCYRVASAPWEKEPIINIKEVQNYAGNEERRLFISGSRRGPAQIQ